MNAKINEAFTITSTDEYDYLNTTLAPPPTELPSTLATVEKNNTNNKSKHQSSLKCPKSSNNRSNRYNAKVEEEMGSLTLVKLTREQIEKEFYEYTLECRRRLDQLFTPTTTTTDSNSSIRSNRVKGQPRNAIQASSSSMKIPSSRNNNNNNNRLIDFSTISGNYKIFKVMPPTMTTTPNIAKASSCSQSRHSRPSNHYHHHQNSTLRPPPQPSLIATTTLLIRDKSDQHQHVDINGGEGTSRVGKSKSPTTLRLKSFGKPLSLEKIWHI